MISWTKGIGNQECREKKKWDIQKVENNLFCSLRCMEEEMYYKAELGSD